MEHPGCRRSPRSHSDVRRWMDGNHRRSDHARRLRRIRSGMFPAGSACALGVWGPSRPQVVRMVRLLALRAGQGHPMSGVRRDAGRCRHPVRTLRLLVGRAEALRPMSRMRCVTQGSPRPFAGCRSIDLGEVGFQIFQIRLKLPKTSTNIGYGPAAPCCHRRVRIHRPRSRRAAALRGCSGSYAHQLAGSCQSISRVHRSPTVELPRPSSTRRRAPRSGGALQHLLGALQPRTLQL